MCPPPRPPRSEPFFYPPPLSPAGSTFPISACASNSPIPRSASAAARQQSIAIAANPIRSRLNSIIGRLANIRRLLSLFVAPAFQSLVGQTFLSASCGGTPPHDSSQIFSAAKYSLDQTPPFPAARRIQRPSPLTDPPDQRRRRPHIPRRKKQLPNARPPHTKHPRQI